MGIRHVIVEGPDGGGKSTLIRELRELTGLDMAPRASRSETGPVESLYDWYLKDMRRISMKGAAGNVYDRHPLISEPIYAPIVRKTTPQEPFDNPSWVRSQSIHMAKQALVVVCLPPLWVVRTNTSQSVQMPGVVDNIQQLWTAYNQFISANRTGVIVYDYTNHDTAPSKRLQIQNQLRGSTRV